ncbi:hypothetical protein Tco_1469232, partial [Tanacetum coccineum]
KVIQDTLSPQDRWSREKHILLVNILGEPKAGVTTRSRFRDSKMQEMKRLADLKAKKEKSEKKLKKVMTPEQLKAQKEVLATYEAKSAKMMEEYNHCITFRDDPLTITKFSYRTKSNDQLLKNLKAKFQWVGTQAGKLGIPPPSQLTAFEHPTTLKKRKRKTKIIHEVFVKENIVVDGMQRNLSIPEGVVGKVSMVIREPEAGIFLYNGNFDVSSKEVGIIW